MPRFVRFGRDGFNGDLAIPYYVLKVSYRASAAFRDAPTHFSYLRGYGNCSFLGCFRHAFARCRR